MGSPVLAPPAAPPPPDLTEAQLRGLTYAETQRRLRAGTGRKNAFLSLNDPAPGDPWYRKPVGG